jgi:hypothetical protein
MIAGDLAEELGHSHRFGGPQLCALRILKRAIPALAALRVGHGRYRHAAACRHP